MIDVEVWYASAPHELHQVALQLPEGSTLAEAANDSDTFSSSSPPMSVAVSVGLGLTVAVAAFGFLRTIVDATDAPVTGACTSQLICTCCHEPDSSSQVAHSIRA